MAESRTAKSIKNSSVALVMYFINLVLQFYSRKIFLDYLGTEILGLNSTATNLLQVLNLAELGISSAISFSLYTPLQKHDNNSVNEIVTFQGYIYKKIATGIILGALVLMCFFPWIFSKIQLPLWYAYVSFCALLFSSLLSYYVNYKQIVLSANQDEYKIVISYKSVLIIKVVFQMLAVEKLNNGYVWWAVLEVLFASVASLSLHIMTIKTFPNLTSVKISFKVLRTKYKVIETKVKQLFFHKIAGFGLSQTTPIILYAYANLDAVTYYQNYMLVSMGCVSLVASIFNGITAGIGNVSAENPDRLLPVFKELFSIRFYMSIVVCYIFYITIPGFISLWIGSNFVLPQSTSLLITIVLFITLSRQTVENYLYSLGLFQDIGAPITEFVINIGASIILGYFWGLNGILTGVIISLGIIVLLWKPFFLFNKGLHKSSIIYFKLYMHHMALAIISIFIAQIYVNKYISLNSNSWMEFLKNSVQLSIMFSIIILIIMYVGGTEIRFFIRRMVTLIRKTK